MEPHARTPKAFPARAEATTLGSIGWTVSVPIRPRRWRSRPRHREKERAPDADAALHPRLAPVGLDETFHDPEPEAHTISSGSALPPKSVEYVLESLGGDADPRIRDADDHVVRASLGSDGDASGLRELHRVTDEVLQDLKEPVFVPSDRREIRRDVQPEL